MKRIESYLREKKRLVEKTLESLLVPTSPLLEELYNSMNYTLLSGGKRIRPVMALASFETVKKENPDWIAPIVCSLELIHTYSLIHDDLPAMDDDPMRRGKPSNHIVFGEDMAILAGDGLLTEAFRTLAESLKRLDIEKKTSLEIISLLGEKAGPRGMVGGQALDIRKDGFKRELKILEEISYRKTGALIECSVVMGGMLAGATRRELEALSSYGRCIGIAFQVVDDILDVTGDEKKVGKKLGKEKGKLTYPNILGVEGSRKEAKRLTERAKASVRIFGENNLLEELAEFLLERVA